MSATAGSEAPLASLAGAIDRLTAVLEAENAVLRTRDTSRLVALTAEKGEAMRAYEGALSAARTASGDFTDVTADQRRDLRAVADTLAAASRENGALLAVAVAASRRVMEVIAQAVGSLDAGPGIYSATGATGRATRAGAPVAVAVSVDRAL